MNKECLQLALGIMAHPTEKSNPGVEQRSIRVERGIKGSSE